MIDQIERCNHESTTIVIRTRYSKEYAIGDCSTTTVLTGAEEHGVQHHSPVLFLILLIPADLRSCLCSTGSHESSAMHKFCTQNAKYNLVFPNLFLYSNFQPGMFLKKLEIPAWPFFGAWEYCIYILYPIQSVLYLYIISHPIWPTCQLVDCPADLQIARHNLRIIQKFV